jgi:hypothetical protein
MPAPIRRRDYQVVGKTDFGQEIRIFDNASIQREINEVLAAAPDDKRSGVILAGDLKTKKRAGSSFGRMVGRSPMTTARRTGRRRLTRLSGSEGRGDAV